MKKRNSHPELRRAAVFGALTLLLVFLFAVGLVQNGNESVRRYNTLIAADEAGGDVEGALNDLRSYIHGHMNTEIGGPNGIYPPIQLKGTYDRLIAAEEARVNNANSNLIQNATVFCEENGPAGFSGGNRIECINTYIDENGAQAMTIDESLYKYDFVAPRWSPDLAGFSLLGVILCAAVTVFNLFLYFRTKHIVHIGN